MNETIDLPELLAMQQSLVESIHARFRAYEALHIALSASQERRDAMRVDWQLLGELTYQVMIHEDNPDRINQ